MTRLSHSQSASVRSGTLWQTVVLDRGVATSAGAYTGSDGRLTIESAGLVYTFDTRIEANTPTLRNAEFGGAVYEQVAW